MLLFSEKGIPLKVVPSYYGDTEYCIAHVRYGPLYPIASNLMYGYSKIQWVSDKY